MFCFNEFAFTVQVKQKKINGTQILGFILICFYFTTGHFHTCTLQIMQPISLLILGSVFSDCVVFYGNCRKVHRNNNDVVDIVTPSPVWCCFWRISLSMRRGVKSVIPFGQSLSVLFRVAYSWPWYANMTSSIKPETHSVPQRRQRTIELRPLVKCTKFGGDRTCSSGDMLADRQTDTRRQLTHGHTDRHAHHNTHAPCRGRSNKKNVVGYPKSRFRYRPKQ